MSKEIVNGEKIDDEIKAYHTRWIILTIFILYGALNSFQWIEYSSITEFVVKYYNISSLAVDWTSIIYMALYPFLVIPCSFLIEKTGLRCAGLIGCIGTALGTCIKVFSINRDAFYIVMIGQALESASQVVILCLPPKIAAIWFKPNEVSTACSLGVFGTQLGCAIGFIIPPKIVRNHLIIDQIGDDLRILCWSLSFVAIPLALAVICYFPNEPPKPPSLAQANERRTRKEVTFKTFFQSLKLLFKNKGFVIHMAAYGINIGVSSAVGTLLSQFIVAYFQNAQEDAGQMGFVMVVSGAIASILFGILLDKTRKYKEVTFFLYLMCIISVAIFMVTLRLNSKILLYISSALMGAFLSAYCPVGFEMAMELTYPSEESTTTGILMAITQILGVLFAIVLGRLNLYVGPLWSLGSQVVLLTIGTIITGYIPNDLRRQKAFQQNDSQKDYIPVPLQEKDIK